MSHALDTAALGVTVDAAGRLQRLVCKPTGHDYASGGPLWRLYYERGERRQETVAATDVLARIEHDGDTIRLQYDALPTLLDGTPPIAMTLRLWLEGDELHADAEICNHTADVLIKELQFPLVGGLNLRPDQALIHTAYGGCRHPDPRRFIRDRYPPTHHWYCNEDHEGLQVQHVYPGSQAASNCFVFAGERQGLYFGSHDATFRNTVHLWRLAGDDLEAGFAKHLFLRPGESITIDGYVLSAYIGSWHAAADKYRAWVDQWYRPLPKPDWLTCDVGAFRGWQRLIMKQQNGRVLFPYDAMPRIFDHGQAAGLNSLFMFGWWPGGMDRGYPDYRPDEALGGEQVLRDNIRRFQQRGGSVILYASGRLVDRDTEFFKRHGPALTIKTRGGAQARDFYLFSNTATYERLYGAVELSPMCLDCPQWIDQLKRVIDLAADYGCRGVFFDQLGLQEYPCCDPTHGHPVPYLTQTRGKRRVIAELRDHARRRDPQMALGVEVFADAVGEFFDFVHGLYHQNYIATNPDYRDRGEKPRVTGFVDWMRYVYPDVIISDRDIRDENDFERRANLALTRGLMHDVEVFRCRRTIAAAPNYQRHLAAINALRERHADLLMRGTYRDTLGFTIDNQDIDARAFRADRRLGVLLTQSHLDAASATLRVSGGRFVQCDGFGDYEVSPEGNCAGVRVERHAVALAIFELDGDHAA